MTAMGTTNPTFGVWNRDDDVALPRAVRRGTYDDSEGYPKINVPDWMADAACAEYPVVRGNVDPWFEPGRRGLAVDLCCRCLVRRDCLEFALDMETDRHRLGIWGGFTPAERQRIAVMSVLDREAMFDDFETIDEQRAAADAKRQRTAFERRTATIQSHRLASAVEVVAGEVQRERARREFAIERERWERETEEWLIATGEWDA